MLVELKTNGFSGASIMRIWPSLLMKKLQLISGLCMAGACLYYLPKFLQICGIRGIWCDRVFLAPEHGVAIG